MSRIGLVSLLVSGVSFVIVLIARFILGGWINVLWAPLLVALAGLIALLILEKNTIIEFLTMRTTKNGLNMGVIIALALVIIASVNFISVRYDQSFDFTNEGINSLADQSKSVLDDLEDTLTFQVFYKGETAAPEKDRMKANLNLYQKYKGDIKVRVYNTYTENLRAQQYLNALPDKDSQKLFVFVEYKDKRIRVEQPLFTEEKLTSAIVKATRTETKTLYFTTNHGEKNFSNQELDGVSGLQSALKDSSFEVKELDLIAEKGVPEDATAVAIIGPRTPLLEAEIDFLLKYAENGGRLFIAADPGERHNLALLTKPLGIEFKNNYILSPIAQLLGKSMASAIGVEYSTASDITNKFRSNMTVFDLVSEVAKAEDTSFDVIELVRTHNQSFATNSLQNIDQSDQRAYPVAVSTQGKYKRLKSSDNKEAKKEDGAGTKEFAAVIFGDSDFVTNQGMILGLNRDLALNSFSFLADEQDMISIRPKQMQGTKIDMTQSAQRTIVIGGIALPLSMFVLSAVLWFRRRGS